MNPRSFGLERDIDWRKAPAGESAEAMNARASRRAAALQHAIAVAVHLRLLRRGYKDLTALAATDLGISYSQLHKMMRGAAPMSLAHIAAL